MRFICDVFVFVAGGAVQHSWAKVCATHRALLFSTLIPHVGDGHVLH